MDNIKQAIRSVIKDTTELDSICSVLINAAEKAEQEGLPYQTLITTVLHKYITNQLVEKEEILKSIRLLKEERVI